MDRILGQKYKIKDFKDRIMPKKEKKMYDQFVRNNMTNRLQADLRSTMKTYDYEKEKLSYQLANLQTTDRSQTNASIASSMDLSSNTSVTLTPRKFYRAPNLTAQSSSSGGFKKEYSGATDKKWKDRKDQADKFKKEKDLLKLPVIHSASSKRSEWESGKFLQMSNPKQGTFSGLEPLPGINAAKALLAESMKIPSIYDPQRTDHAFDTTKSKKAAKKVTFADENHGTLLLINQIETNASESFPQDSKNSEGKGPVPRLNLKANKLSHVARPIRPRKTSLLPPLQIIPSEMRQNPQKITDGVNRWKSIYSRIVDPEEKTRALADIFSALRLKKFENEQAMKYGDSPRPAGGDEIKDFLAINTLGRIAYKDEQGHTRKGLVPTPRSTSVSRLSNGHPNTQQLQKYLQQMSRSRKILEQLHAQQCSRSSSHTFQPMGTPVSVKA